MKVLFSLPLALVLLLVLTVDLPAQTKKYDIKSGIITFDNIMSMGSMKITHKVIVYFDDYGMKECKDTYDGGKLKESFFSDGKTLYTVIHADKAVYKRGDALRGTELKFDWDEVSATDKKEGKAKKVRNMRIAGKDCAAFEVSSSSGRTTFAGWNHICLLTDMSGKGMRNTSTAVRVEENVIVPPEKFGVPTGYQVKPSVF